MMRTTCLLAVVAAACSVPATGHPVDQGAATSAISLDPALRAREQELLSRALEEDDAINILAELLHAAPKRLSGSPGAEDAVRFCVAKMRELGLDNVHTEPCTVPHWVRGEETASVESPRALPLRITALGGSEPTPPEGITAELLEVKSFDELRALGSKAAGKIVFFDRPMSRTLMSTGQAYGEAVPQRTEGAVEAAKVGAVGALVRSITTVIDEFPHTGMMRYADGVPKVPAAAVCTKDAEELAALLERGPVRIHMLLGCQTLPDVTSANVVGEIKGSEHPEQVVVIGGHLDAWELGDGAEDDGAGVAHVLEAMRLLRVTGIHPKRTIRAVLFMNEENGTRGALAYAAAHSSELSRCVAAFETDSGGFTPVGFSTDLKGAKAEAFRQLVAPLAEVRMGAVLPGGGGADIGPMAKAGVPLYGLVVDDNRYFDYHHSARDTIGVINSRELALGAAVLAYAASAVADQ
jgi:carboxypeptidase Q